MPRRCFLAKVGRVSFSVLAVTLIAGWMSLPGAATGQAEITAPAAATQAAAVSGFRSAKFGMNEQEVRAAIAKDFDKTDADVSESTNTIERTTLLSITVPDLLEGGGTAQVSYIFGYKSKALIQVGVSWSKATDPDITDAMLVANGDVLSNHFSTEGFAPDTVTTGSIVSSGILLFRGVDAKERSAILLLQGKFEENEGGQKALVPARLALLYSADPDNPDIFRVKDGSF